MIEVARLRSGCYGRDFHLHRTALQVGRASERLDLLLPAAMDCRSGGSLSESEELAKDIIAQLEELRRITAESDEYALPASLLKKTGVSRTVALLSKPTATELPAIAPCRDSAASLLKLWRTGVALQRLPAEARAVAAELSRAAVTAKAAAEAAAAATAARVTVDTRAETEADFALVVRVRLKPTKSVFFHTRRAAAREALQLGNDSGSDDDAGLVGEAEWLPSSASLVPEMLKQCLAPAAAMAVRLCGTICSDDIGVFEEGMDTNWAAEAEARAAAMLMTALGQLVPELRAVPAAVAAWAAGAELKDSEPKEFSFSGGKVQRDDAADHVALVHEPNGATIAVWAGSPASIDGGRAAVLAAMDGGGGAQAAGQRRVDRALVTKLPGLESELLERTRRIFDEHSDTDDISSGESAAAAAVPVVERLFMMLMAVHEVAIAQAVLAVTGELGSADRLAGAVTPCPDPAAAQALRPEHCLSLASDGLTVVEQAVPAAEMALLRAELESMSTEGVLRTTFQEAEGTRKDVVAWVGGDVPPPGPAATRAVALLKGLAHELNGWADKTSSTVSELTDRIGGGKLVVPADCMVACYAGDGRGYVRHLDNTCSDQDGLSDCHNIRVVTAILYCNPDWQPADGGCLRYWPVASAADGNSGSNKGRSAEPLDSGGHIDLAPKGGRLVLFRSKVLPHEVLPAWASRYAISLWMLQRN